MKGTIIKLACLMTIIAVTVYSEIPITLTSRVPASVNNSTKQFFPPVVSQEGSSCGNANGIGYNFTYAMNRARNSAASTSANQYPYAFTYHFLNDGSSRNGTSHMYVDALNIVKENGIPSTADYGGASISGYKWLNGYDLWYRAMQNRVEEIDTINMLASDGLAKLKQWLYDHGEGSENGGVGNFGCGASGWQLSTIPSGHQSGRSIMVRYGATGDHGQTIVGYDDSVRYDFNRDGRFTNDVDQNNDGRVDLKDWEVGALYMANSWGTSFGDRGFYYCPYRHLANPASQGGIGNANRVCIIKARASYKPKMALKASITHPQRNQIALSVGVAPNQTAATPTIRRTFKHQFNYAGGALPMCGQNLSSTIEIGLDVSDLLDSIAGAREAKFFLIVTSRGGTGSVNSLSLMDYTAGSTARETRSTQSNVSIASTTYIGVATTLSTSVYPANSSHAAPRTATVRRSNGVIQVSVPLVCVRELSLIDMQGKTVALFRSDAPSPWIQLPCGLKTGMYIIKARTAEGMAWTGKIHIM
ncbi:MAG: hypothetical protein JW768_06145 [Chitinispirillaceae bacterium]|nr:hypothetical protein [Chitinispirillaceae bacterium]